MKSEEDYYNVISIVSEVTEVKLSEIFSSKSQEHRDARWIAVQLLSDIGYYPSKICSLTGLSTRSVNRILTDMRSRRDKTWKLLRRNLEECRIRLGINADSEN